MFFLFSRSESNKVGSHQIGRSPELQEVLLQVSAERRRSPVLHVGVEDRRRGAEPPLAALVKVGRVLGRLVLE